MASPILKATRPKEVRKKTSTALGMVQPSPVCSGLGPFFMSSLAWICANCGLCLLGIFGGVDLTLLPKLGW